MKILNPIKKTTSKDNRNLSLPDSPKLLAVFFNGVVIALDKVYKYDS